MDEKVKSVILLSIAAVIKIAMQVLGIVLLFKIQNPDIKLLGIAMLIFFIGYQPWMDKKKS